MEIKPLTAAVVALGVFVSIVAVQVFLEYQSNEDFREKFAQRDFSLLRPRVIAEENMTEPEDTEETMEVDTEG